MLKTYLFVIFLLTEALLPPRAIAYEYNAWREAKRKKDEGADTPAWISKLAQKRKEAAIAEDMAKKERRGKKGVRPKRSNKISAASKDPTSAESPEVIELDENKETHVLSCVYNY